MSIHPTEYAQQRSPEPTPEFERSFTMTVMQHFAKQWGLSLVETDYALARNSYHLNIPYQDIERFVSHHDVFPESYIRVEEKISKLFGDNLSFKGEPIAAMGSAYLSGLRTLKQQIRLMPSHLLDELLEHERIRQLGKKGIHDAN